MTSRADQKRNTTARLIDAAAATYRAKGYAATTVEDIADAAGVTRATFYLHFEGKLDIYRALGRDVAEDIDNLHERLVQVAREGSRDAIRDWLNASFEQWERLKEFAVIQEQVAALHPEVRDAMTRHFNTSVEAMAQGLSDGTGLNPGECRVRALLAYVQLQNLFQHWRLSGWDVDRERVLEVMTDMWCAALVGVSALDAYP